MILKRHIIIVELISASDIWIMCVCVLYMYVYWGLLFVSHMATIQYMEYYFFIKFKLHCFVWAEYV